MNSKNIPFDLEKIKSISKDHPTPFYVYDEKAMLENLEKFLESFNVLNGFKEFFAVKVNPNPFINKLLVDNGCGLDCSSMAELVVAEKLGVTGENIMFSSNDTPLEEYQKAIEMGAIINLDDFSHIDFIDKNLGLPNLVCFRFNPGSERKGNVIIGDPKESKFGFTREQILEGYKILKEKGVERFGLHTMIISNELDESFFIETARMIFSLALEVYEKTGVKIEFVNLGGGIGIPYKPEDKGIRFEHVANEIKKLYDEIISPSPLKSIKIFLECGRVITGPFGYLVTKVNHLKNTYKDYVGTDASMANLMRPGIYGAYHHITVLGKENDEKNNTYDITGSLCENNDKFAIDRPLPQIDVGDILVIHDAGAHSHSMGFNYNGKLRSSELLLQEDGSFFEIRRAETIKDYFSTIDFNKLQDFMKK